jgi:hypothetical protein
LISPIISGVSSALQTLDQLLGLQAPSTGGSAGGAFSTGKTLPAGAQASPQGAGPTTPSGQFAPATLSFLTSLQDTGSHLWSTARGALTHDLNDITSIVTELEQALNGPASTSSAQASSLASMLSSGPSPKT